MRIIGIVGLPASGKSTVAEILSQLGATWINADRLAHAVLQRPDIAARVLEHFGPSIAGPDGKIDRQLLGRRVFGDDAESQMALKYLESLVHPPTREAIQQQIHAAEQKGAQGIVLDVPLLLENGWGKQCDEVWFIDSAETVRSAAARQRGWKADELSRREARQMPRAEKIRHSTQIIKNDGSLAELRLQVEKLWRDCVNRTAVEPSQSSPRGH